MVRFLIFAGAMIFLASCAPVGPDFVKPVSNTPLEWSEKGAQYFSRKAPDLTKWWMVFQDPILNDLVETARRQNNTLEIAGLRVLEARAQLGIAIGSQYPQSQIISADATYVSPSDNTGVASNWKYGLGATAAWEIDFWGRLRRGIESADASFLASIAAYDQALVLLTAQVVETYTIVRTLEDQLKIAHENAALQQRSYNIAEVLHRNGETSELDKHQAQTLLLSTRATIPNLDVQLKQTRNALSILVGQAPGTVNHRLKETKGIPNISSKIFIGFPADMLRRRPDVRQAELQAMAQNAQVGVAQASLYPSFSLVGSIELSSGGSISTDFGDLFSAEALAFSVGPSLVWPFLNYGRIKNYVRVKDARLQQALVNYREVVLQAAREAEDAMTGFIGIRKQADILAKAVLAATSASELSVLRYGEGFSDYQRVLTSQQSLALQQQRYSISQSNAVINLISLYKAMGGDWEGRNWSDYIDSETLKTMQGRTDWGKMIEDSPLKAPDTTKANGHFRKVDW